MSLRTWGVLSLGFFFAACANPVDDQGYVDDGSPQGGGALAPAPVKGGYDGNVATDLPSSAPVGTGGGGGSAGGGGGGGSGAEPPTHPEPGLTAYYDFDSATGYVFDVSGSGNHGTPTAAGVSFSAPGHIGQAASFSGGHGSIVVTASPSLDFNAAATIEFWVRLSSVTSGTILSRGSGWGDSSVRVRTTQGNLQVLFSRASSGSAILTTNPNILGTAWSHVAVVNDGAELKLFLNGKLESSVVGGQLGALASNLVIGKNESTDTAFNGSLDELKWWGVARTPAQICTDAGGTISGASCSLP
jgi:hypothetical protein